MFFFLTKANLKRLTKYLPHLIISVFILLAICTTAGLVIAENIYKDTVRQPVPVAYYLTEDEDSDYAKLAIGMLESTSSMQEAVELTRVYEINDGYSMLENNDALYFLIIPEHFVYGILYGTNTPLEIITNDSSSANSFITNELFLSYGTYLGVAQAAVYSALDSSRAAGYSDEAVSSIQNAVNMTFLDRSLNKAQYMDSKTATLEGGYTIRQHYLSCAVMLVLFFAGFVMMPFMKNYSNGMRIRLEIAKINKFHLLLQNLMCMLIATLIAYIPCHLVIGIQEKNINTEHITYIFIAALGISFITAIIGTFGTQEFTCNMMLFTITLLLAYIGGGIIPDALLPKAVSHISDYLPGKYIINALSHSLFGGGYGI